jgi:hypothetical protein
MLYGDIRAATRGHSVKIVLLEVSFQDKPGALLLSIGSRLVVL